MKKELEKIGFDSKEVAVYLALLELGQTTVARISKKSKVKRTTVYDVLNSLKEKGLVGKTISKGKTYYFAEDPRVIGEILKEKTKIFDNLVPELLSVANFLDKKPKIRFYEGEGGIKDIYNELIEQKDDIIRGWYAPNFMTGLGDDYFYEFVKKRVARKIMVEAISPADPKLLKYTENTGPALRKVKYINLKKYDYEIDIAITLFAGRKIAIVAYKEDFGLIIESDQIFKALYSIFKFMWAVLPDNDGNR